MSTLVALEQRWRDERRLRFRRDLFWLVLFAMALGGAMYVGQVRLSTFIEGIPSLGDYFISITPSLHVATLGHDLGAWYWNLGHWSRSLFETLVMAFVATVFGVVGALALAMFGARNLAPNRTSYVIARRLADVLRAMPELVSATVLVFSFGIGPFAGVMALALHSAGALAKLFSEVAENAAAGPMDGVKASGGRWLQVLRFGMLPQILPNMISYILLRLELNVRSATILGFVGAGGIGQDLMYVAREFLYTDVSAIVVMIIVAVSVIDIFSEHLRQLVLNGLGPRTRMLASVAHPALLWALCLVLFVAGMQWLGFFNLHMLTVGIGRLANILGFMLPPSGFDEFPHLLGALGQTLAMALAGSVLANLIAIPLGILASRSVVRLSPLQFVVRRLLDLLRGIDVLIWALIFIAAVGLGPFAGILAMMVNDAGSLAKVYGEAIDASDRGASEGVQAAGGSAPLVFRYGILPNVLPVMLSNAIYFFESNTRSATVLGVVGAGGIGLELFDRIQVNDWHSASLVVLMIIITVMLIDVLTGWVRRALT